MDLQVVPTTIIITTFSKNFFWMGQNFWDY